MAQLDSRFWAKVVISAINTYNGTQCWEWASAVTVNGYGMFWFNRAPEYAHRLSYENKHEKIPKGLVINHLCRNRKCVNPDHLEAVTQQENCRKGLTGFLPGLMQRLKTHCPKGHEYNEENTRIKNDGSRSCRACNNAWTHQYNHNKKMEILG